MRAVEMEIGSETVGPREAYALVRDFARYPELVESVRSVTVHPPAPGGETHSDWEVDFRSGVLTWSEADVFDDEGLTVSFRQTEGDFEEFTGQWEVTGDGSGGCRVRFTAKFDFGLPSLAGIIDPVAERVLQESVARILTTLLGLPAAAAPAQGRAA
ncbi:SRPBCC family protein [Streptomyces sp. NPDC007346]|uniref:type II toxin-antitoxin system RatA family toxin n=1 Tax=Streptomyces sp. NPDC007346 TaxID=3154682 RepID=UPI00345343F2